MKIKKSMVVYNVLCNVPVCFFLTLASALIAGNGAILDRWNFALNYAVSFILAMLIGLFVPLTRIGRWFTGLFGVRNDTYAGNPAYRILATIVISFIFFVGINPPLTILNFLILRDCTFRECALDWLVSAPIMLLVGFFASLISDPGAYKAAHAIDKNF